MARFDDLFSSLAQRRGFREYLTGLLLPRDRNKTLTCLAGAEPVAGAQHPAVQRLQFFLSESRWDHEQVNARRLEMLLADPSTAPHGGGVLVIDDSGDRKDGRATAHVGRQWLGRLGKTDNGVVTVTTLRADERLYYPLHAVPYTPARHFPKGRSDPGFATKLQIAAVLARRATEAAVDFRAVAADCAYGDQDGFRGELAAAELPFAMALKRRRGVWAYGDEAYTRQDAARDLSWHGPDRSGDPQLDRAELQAGQGRTGLGRLPGPLRCRHPPPPHPGELRVLLLLGHPGQPARSTRPAGRALRRSLPTRAAREGAHAYPTSPLRPAGHGHCARSATG
ncbi:transposase [Streptomyces sp. NPDC059679]|uniref:IS701 family transposase n=1 Tax=Streptomyces sp. NPDC059679 TaxID=3346903 RepID=UPI00368E1DB6